MTDPTPDSKTADASRSQLARSELAGMEEKFLRLTFWQTVLSVAGVFTGAVALYAALNESQAVRQQTAATVWPYVQFEISDTSDGNAASFSLSLNNVGVGPARMQGAKVALNGQVIRDWQALTGELMGADVALGVDYGKSSIGRRVLAPGESLIAFQTQHTGLALKVQEAVYSDSLTVSYCYCSIFDDCWNVSTSSDARQEDLIQPVLSCPVYGDESFLD